MLSFPPLVCVSHLVLFCVALPPAWVLIWIHLRGKYCGLTQENVPADICCQWHNKTHHGPDGRSDAPALARAEKMFFTFISTNRLKCWHGVNVSVWNEPNTGTDLKEAQVVNVVLGRKKVSGWFILKSSSFALHPIIEKINKEFTAVVF